MKKWFKVIKITLISLLSVFILMVVALFLYTRDSYKPTDEMYDTIEQLDISTIEVVNAFDHIRFVVDQPKKNIVIIPGGKVKPDSYQYLAVQLALSGYDVTIIKTLFNLAILTPNYGARFLKEDIENVVIGHSLGGTVASMISSGNKKVTDIVFLASYPISDVSDKHVLVITAEFDLVLNQASLTKSTSLLPTDYVSFEIQGGTHAQFGWYGKQKGDGEALISTKTQQDIIVLQIVNFIE